MENVTQINALELATTSALSEYKEKISQVVTLVNGIQIADRSSFKISLDIIKQAKALFKAIEEKRKAIKEPYLKDCRFIDGIAKDLTDSLNIAIGTANKKAVDYNDMLREKRKIMQKQLADKLLKIQENKEESLCSLQEERDALLEILSDFMTTKENQDTDFIKTIEDSLLLNFMEESKADLIEWMYAFIDPNEIPIDHKQMEFKIKTAYLDIRANIEGVNILERLQTTSSDLEEKIGSFRETWTFEVSDMKMVPLEWLALDTKKVESWIKENQLILIENGTVNGLRFFKKSTLISR